MKLRPRYGLIASLPLLALVAIVVSPLFPRWLPSPSEHADLPREFGGYHARYAFTPAARRQAVSGGMAILISYSASRAGDPMYNWETFGVSKSGQTSDQTILWNHGRHGRLRTDPSLVSPENLAYLKEALAALADLPPSVIPPPPPERLLLVSYQAGPTWRTRFYDRRDVPQALTRAVEALRLSSGPRGLALRASRL